MKKMILAGLIVCMLLVSICSAYECPKREYAELMDMTTIEIKNEIDDLHNKAIFLENKHEKLQVEIDKIKEDQANNNADYSGMILKRLYSQQAISDLRHCDIELEEKLTQVLSRRESNTKASKKSKKNSQ